MPLHFGRKLQSIPGPSVIPDRVLNAMHRAAPNIYEGDLIDMTETLFDDLKTLARTKGKVAIYISNGHGAWEAALSNVLSKGDRVLVLGTGRFALGWGELGQKLGLSIQTLDFGLESDVDTERVKTALLDDKAGDIKAVLAVQTDTASSVRNDIAAIRRAMDKTGHPALLLVDCIASLGCERYEMDTWGVDVMVSACQKGLMTPPGLSFVFFNPKAEQAHASAGLVTSYWDWAPRYKAEIYYENFCGTAPTHHLFGLREALDILVHEEGIENAWARHDVFARALWAAIENWGHKGAIRANITDPAKRSRSVTTIHTAPDDGKKIRHWCEQIAGVTLGIGLGFGLPGSKEGDSVFRIGHMGHLNVPMFLGTLGAIDAALKALAIPHGAGALEAASMVIARS